MSGKRDLGVYVADMVEACEHIIMFAQGQSDSELMDATQPTRGAILHHLMILGEATKQLSQEWLGRYPDVPWKRIAGMRDMVVHYYFGLDEQIVVETVRTSLPAVLPQLRAMLQEMDAETEDR